MISALTFSRCKQLAFSACYIHALSWLRSRRPQIVIASVLRAGHHGAPPLPALLAVLRNHGTEGFLDASLLCMFSAAALMAQIVPYPPDVHTIALEESLLLSVLQTLPEWQGTGTMLPAAPLWVRNDIMQQAYELLCPSLRKDCLRYAGELSKGTDCHLTLGAYCRGPYTGVRWIPHHPHAQRGRGGLGGG